MGNGASRQLFWKCQDGNPGDGCSAFCPCKSPNRCEAWYHKCRAPGKHGDHCHATRPCGSAYKCANLISAHSSYQLCIPKCKNYSSEMTNKLRDDGYSPDSNPGFGEKWDGGVVPFEAHCSMDDHESALFAQGMKNIEDKTNIRFVPYDSNEHGDNYIILSDVDAGSANSWVGKMKKAGWQRVNLDCPWGMCGFIYGICSS